MQRKETLADPQAQCPGTVPPQAVSLIDDITHPQDVVQQQQRRLTSDHVLEARK